MLKVYVAGPIRGAGDDDREVNVLRAIDVGVELIRAGFNPFIPHLDYYVKPRYPEMQEWGTEKWMEFDLPWLEACDAVLRVPGASRGADAEVAHAEKIGTPVFYSIATLKGFQRMRQPPCCP